MEIKKVLIIGLGALGILFGDIMLKKMPKTNVRFIADKDRIERYKRDKIYCNGKICDFHYVSPYEECDAADLLMFTVKFNDLEDAIKAAKSHVGENTIIISLLNGISSEGIISNAYGEGHTLDCVAQGMDAVKEGNKLTYKNKGILCIGGEENKTKAVADFFDKMEIPYCIDTNMKKRFWGKFMLNVGVNQTVAVYETNYGGIQREGKARDIMIAAMREVLVLSEKEGVNLTEADLQYWLDIIAPLNPEGKPSLRQDTEAKRKTEVELFAGTVLNRAKKHGLETPVNKFLYNKIKELENSY